MCHNKDKTCMHCPAAVFQASIDFCSCNKSEEQNDDMVITCTRRPEQGVFQPSIRFDECPEYQKTKYGYMLRDMRVMILGMDGYLGWALALRLSSLGCQVYGVDNYQRRNMVAEKGSHTAIPIPRMTQRLQHASDYGYSLRFRKIDIRNEPERLKEYMMEVKPESVVHYAEIPSAPYSMVNRDHAIQVQDNNTLGTLGLLYLMKQICPNSSLIKLGTMGEYGTPISGRPIFEGVFPEDATLSWDGRRWPLGGELIPRNPGSFYHVGKVQDTYNVFEACRFWGLRSYDIMQGVIYGMYTDETMVDPVLRTRFDFDEWFGTAINRFCVQAVTGVPLTVYGSGKQIRGYISLEDAMQCMTRMICSPPGRGEYVTVNQMSGVYQVDELAEMVAKAAGMHGIDVKINRVQNPRVEDDEHPYEVVAKRLQGELGFIPKVRLQDEINHVITVLLEDEICSRLQSKTHVMNPVTHWDEKKKDCMILESYTGGSKTIQPGEKKRIDLVDGIGTEMTSIRKQKSEVMV